MSAEGRKFPRWTPERLRKYAGFEHFTDKEANEAIDTLERLARILLSIYTQNNELNEKSGDPTELWQRPKESKDG